MAGRDFSPAKAVLFAVQLAVQADIKKLRSLVARHRKTLRLDLTLRILLSHLPESLTPSKYVSFLKDLLSGNIEDDAETQFDSKTLEGLGNDEARKKVRNLGLLPLAWPDAPLDAPTDPLVLFLIHRSLRIDQNTGLISKIPALLTPFLSYSTYLRTWLISTVLPLLRFSYEYHPTSAPVHTIEDLEKLDDRGGIRLLLSETGKSREHTNSDPNVGRDLRGLAGPWLYGNSRSKRRKVRRNSSWDMRTVTPLNETPIEDHKYAGWEEVYEWIVTNSSWETAVIAVEQWDGPSDVDLGGFEDGALWLEEDEQQYLEKRYARSALAAAYFMPEEPAGDLMGVHRILARINTLLTVLDDIPTLQTSADLLSPVQNVEAILSPENAVYLRNGMLDEKNVLTIPNEVALSFLHALLVSAYLLSQEGYRASIRRAGELALLQEEREQKIVFRNFMASISNGPKEDDAYWIRRRREILWLCNWGVGEDATVTRKGVFGKLQKDLIEAEILKVLLANTRYRLAQQVYETSVNKPLPQETLKTTILSAAMNAYDNATNASRSRGGVKKCDDILKTFSETLRNSPERDQMSYLISVTDQIGQYRLVFKQGEPFTPVNLRVHGDPIAILGKMLDQNPRSYAKLNEFIRMGREMVKADLLPRDRSKQAVLSPVLSKQLCAEAEKCVVSMCIDAALASDDFETAYSYVVNRLRDIASKGQEPASTDTTASLSTSSSTSNLSSQAPSSDDYCWRAALQAGKYRLNPQTVLPTHFGSDSGNLEIRHLEHRMQCLGHALRLAPNSTLQEILNVYRRCEEELDVQMKREEEKEIEWDRRADEEVSGMPGDFGFATANNRKAIPDNGKKVNGRSGEEAPVSLFDLSRASINRAQSGFSALAMLRGKSGRNATVSQSPGADSPGLGSLEQPLASLDSVGSGQERVRKRDQLKDAAVGTMASGIGWLINAPAPNQSNND